MDWLIEAATQVEREVFWSVASLLDLEVDLAGRLRRRCADLRAGSAEGECTEAFRVE